MEIGLPVPEKKSFKGFLPYLGMVAILVMGPASCHQIFISLYLNLVQIGKVVSEKIWFKFLYVHDLGPSSRDDLDLQYSRASLKNLVLKLNVLPSQNKFNIIIFIIITNIPSYIHLDDCSY